MKLPNRRTGALLVLALLLAAISTGSLTICDAFIYGEPQDGGPIVVTLQAGDVATDITGSDGFSYRFDVCPTGSLPEGAYFQAVRDTRGLGSVSINLVTTTNTPPGNYQLPYVESDVLLFGSFLYTGILDLTVTAPDVTLTACLYAFSESEILLVNQPITFYGCCSQSTEANPIVQYKWWYNYNGNPSSAPDATTTFCESERTYTTPGAKAARLVVRAQNGDEAATAQTITVNAP